MASPQYHNIKRLLTVRYVVGLGAVAIALAAAFAVVEGALRDRVADSHEINLAGRQRMLSQKVAKEALALASGLGGSRPALEASADEWAKTHSALLNGDPAQGLRAIPAGEAYASLDSLTGVVGLVHGAAHALGPALDSGDTDTADRVVSVILESEGPYLKKMNRVVYALDRASQAAVERLRGLVIGLVVLLIGVLAAVARWMLRPSVEAVTESIEQLNEQGRLLWTVIDTVPDHIYVRDGEGQVTLRNFASARDLGVASHETSLSEGDALSSNRFGTCPPDEALLADDLTVIRTGEPVFDREERSADGKWLLTTKIPLRDGDGRTVGLVGVTRDVTVARQATDLFRSLVEHSVAGTGILRGGRFVYVNPRLAEIFGYTPGEMAGLFTHDVIHLDDRQRVDGILCEGGGPGDETTIVRGRRADGGTVHVELAGVSGEYGGRPAVIATVVDVTERAALERTLYHRAHHDDLTGLPNRALFMSRLNAVVEEAEASHAVLFIDLDRFKVVNDTLGHSAGDELLRALGGRLLRTIGRSAMAARIGGDEFAVLLSVEDVSEAEAVARRTVEALSAPVELGGRQVVAGASVGVVVVRPDHRSADAVLVEADLAMYDAKRTGRNRSVTYARDTHGPGAVRLALEMDLADAVDRGELRLAYQPIVDLSDGALVGFEALVRWQHPELGLLYPDAFIGAAESSGHIVGIDRWVLREAARQVGTWTNARGVPLSISVNCTGLGLLDRLYTDDVRAVIDDLGPHQLVIEITETLLVDDPEAVASEIGHLRDRGVRFCVDDFGTGYSSLTALHALPLDRVKVDRSFVGRMDTDGRAREVVRTVLALADVLETSVVAEGIEVAEHLAILGAMGCRYGQGYLFSRPLWAADAEALLAQEAAPWAELWGEVAA